MPVEFTSFSPSSKGPEYFTLTSSTEQPKLSQRNYAYTFALALEATCTGKDVNLSKNLTELLDNLPDNLKPFYEHYKIFFNDLLDRLSIPDEDEEFMINWAQFNQQLVNDFYIVTSDDQKNENFIKSAQTLIDFVHQLKASSIIRAQKLGERMSTIIDGARAQVALMRLLQSRGCTVLVPNTPEEINLMDVAAGVDFIAIKPDGQMLLIDAKKSRVYLDEQGMQERHIATVTHGLWLQDDRVQAVVTYLSSYLNDPNYNFTTWVVHVPENSLIGLASLDKTTQSEILQKLGLQYQQVKAY